MIVCKFGGSSLCDADGFRRVAAIVRANKERKIVVVSAVGKRHSEDEKVTDMLYRAYRNSEQREMLWQAVCRRYAEIAKDLGVAWVAPPPFCCADGLAAWLSVGEYCSARLLAAYLSWRFVDAKDLFVFSTSGVLQEKLTMDRLSGLSKYTVVPGFYGATMDGTICTFSRGGSDVSAAWIAAVHRADLYENWTDVDGVLGCDPRVVRMKPIDQMSYNEAALMARLGAQVLHPDCILPVERAGVPLWVGNSRNPNAKGTLISEQVASAPMVCGLRDCLWLRHTEIRQIPFEGWMQVGQNYLVGDGDERVPSTLWGYAEVESGALLCCLHPSQLVLDRVQNLCKSLFWIQKGDTGIAKVSPDEFDIAYLTVAEVCLSLA